jgi:DNA-binding NarL/FixJ family response regulator
MATSGNGPAPVRDELARELVALFGRLGVVALVRDPDSAEVLAAVPGAESSILGADPRLVNVVSTRLNGLAVRIESLRTDDQAWHELTPRQLEIADGLMGGLGNQELSERMGISEHTVRRHVEAVFRWLGVSSREDAAAELARRRLIGTLPERSGNGPGNGRVTPAS